MDTEETRVYVRFGPGPAEELLTGTAEKVLTLLRRDHPGIFLQLLGEALGIDLDAQTVPRQRRNGHRP
jgi:hypothetical protein